MVAERISRHPLRWLLPVQAALLFSNLGLLPVWGDEQFTLDVVALPWNAVASALAADIHPPLYFVLLKAWMALGFLTPIVWARLFSAAVALLTTVALDRLWLRTIAAETRLWFLALWIVSPLLLLDARMARSYSLQTLFTVLAFAALLRALARPAMKNAAILALALAALLYTHYLPGLAVGAVALGALARKDLKLAAASAALSAALYAPWVPVLFDGLGRAAARHVYHLAPNVLAELVLRVGYWFAAFSFGEAYDWFTWIAAVLLAPLLILLAARGARRDGSGLVRAAILALPVGFIGTWRWVSFAFTPARLLFLLPAYLFALALGVRRARDRYVAAAMLALNIVGIGFYFGRSGYLNPGYLIPYEQMAQRIEAAAPPDQTLVLADAINADPKPLRAALDPAYEVVVDRNQNFASQLRLRLAQRGPAVVWRLSSTRRLAAEPLSPDYRLEQTTEYLPYNALQRRLLEVFSRQPAPEAHYAAQLWRREASP